MSLRLGSVCTYEGVHPWGAPVTGLQRVIGLGPIVVRRTVVRRIAVRRIALRRTVLRRIAVGPG
ncbi:hypothetical protein [Nocardia abscessus]|uniref:hypothetical protein n=1 Tax=Nocardia abscessus TaxID=120957 RepID=UPI0024555002|nr:hypothetical protein [Nocardia abscessus]